MTDVHINPFSQNTITILNVDKGRLKLEFPFQH